VLPLDPELPLEPELVLEPELPLEPELVLEPEPPLEPELPELVLLLPLLDPELDVLEPPLLDVVPDDDCVGYGFGSALLHPAAVRVASTVAERSVSGTRGLMAYVSQQGPCEGRDVTRRLQPAAKSAMNVAGVGGEWIGRVPDAPRWSTSRETAIRAMVVGRAERRWPVRCSLRRPWSAAVDTRVTATVTKPTTLARARCTLSGAGGSMSLSEVARPAWSSRGSSRSVSAVVTWHVSTIYGPPRTSA
jgi:hypothetical protein